LERLLEVPMRLGEIPRRARLLGLFAMELRDDRPLGFARDALEAPGMIDGLVPVLLVLLDADQVAPRGRHVRVHRDEVAEQRLGTNEQAGAHVVLAELEQGDRLFFVAQIGPRDEVLVHADRSIDLAAAAKEIAERQVRLDRVAVELGELQEHFDGLVRLLVEQIIEAAEVAGGKLTDADTPRTLAAAPADEPARERREREQQRYDREEKRGKIRHASTPGGAGVSRGPDSAASRRDSSRVSARTRPRKRNTSPK